MALAKVHMHNGERERVWGRAVDEYSLAGSSREVCGGEIDGKPRKP